MALYRVHEGPTPEKKTILQNYLRSLGLGLSISDEPTPSEYQAIAAATKDRPDAQQIHTMLLRSMQQAIYTAANSGHFGLSYEAYTHFTSPIRRYPDLLVHRVIKAILAGKRYHLHLAQTEDAPKPARGGKGTQASREEAEAWESAGAHCSANERRADEASRDVEAWLKCKYMREHLGEEYGGTVSAVTTFGLFVQLDELYVEGLVHITELGGEYFRFDEARQELRGERTGVRYSTGTRVRVQVSRVDLDGRKIDFRLVRDSVVGAARGSRGSSEKGTSAVETLKGLQEADRAVKKGARKDADKKGAAKPTLKKDRVAAARPEAVAAARRAQDVRTERKGKRARRG
jgi:ribonuclease R